MNKEKLKTGAMLNPECQKCLRKDTCNNKTLCAYLIPNDYFAAANLQQPIQEPIKLTLEEIQKLILIDKLNSQIFGLDIGEGYSRSSMGGMR